MSNYIDISSFEPENIDYSLYLPWSEQGDGVSRICLRVDQGVGVPDSLYQAHYSKAVSAGVQQIIHYHFAYPWLHPEYAGAQAEVDAFKGFLGTRLRDNDLLMLDAEDVKGASGPAGWYFDFLHILSGNLGLPAERCTIYSYLAYIQAHLQDARLAGFPLIFARYGAGMHPPCPAPWSSYMALQYTASGHVPGVPEAVDVDVFYAPVAPPPPPATGPDLAKIKADAEDILAQLG